MKSKNGTILILIAVGIALAHPAASGDRDWPLWSGPHRNLTASAHGLFERPDLGLERLWSKPLGAGYSGISVVGERLVTAFSDGTSDVLVALDAGTGKERWRYRIAATYKGHDQSDDGPITTPTIHDGLVYGLGPWGQLFALRLADGHEVFSRHLVDELGARAPIYGFHSTPTLVGGVLVMQTGGADGHSISGLDPKTGKLLWSTGDDTVGYQSPMAFSIDGEEVAVAVTNLHLFGLAPRTGEVLWKEPHRLEVEEGEGFAQPLPVGKDRVLLNEWFEAALFRVENTAGRFRVRRLWHSPALQLSITIPVPFKGHLYGFSGRFLTCVDAATGEMVWKSRRPGEGNLVLVDGFLIILTTTGQVVVAEATPEGYRERARVRAMDNSHLTRPSFAAGRILVRNEREIVAIGVTGGQGR